MRREVTLALERWSSAQGDLRAQNAAYRLAWGNGEPANIDNINNCGYPCLDMVNKVALSYFK
jgi:hypothetical protein